MVVFVGVLAFMLGASFGIVAAALCVAASDKFDSETKEDET